MGRPGIVVSVSIVTGLLLLSNGCGGYPSPESVVKGFFNAVNAGDISKAQEYLYERTVAKQLGTGRCFGAINENQMLQSLIGTMREVEILSVRGGGKEDDGAIVKYRIIFKPTVIEEAKKEREYRDELLSKSFFIKNRNKRNRIEKELNTKVFFCSFVNEYKEEVKAELIKLTKPKGWRIRWLRVSLF